MGRWWRWALVCLDGVALSWMVSVSASVNLPLQHKVQKFSSGTSSPRWSRNKGCKMVVVGGTWQVTKLKILYNAAHLQLTKEILLRNYLFAVVVYSQNLGWFLYQILANFRLRFDSVLSSFMVAG